MSYGERSVFKSTLYLFGLYNLFPQLRDGKIVINSVYYLLVCAQCFTYVISPHAQNNSGSRDDCDPYYFTDEETEA